MKPRPLEKNELEQILFEFEQAWFDNRATRVEDFSPSIDTSNYLEVLTELARSEMEFRADNRGDFSAEQYFRRFPVLGQNEDSKKAIVFEEYRLRRVHGEPVNAAELGKQYGIDSTHWPDVSKKEANAAAQTPSTTPASVSKNKIDFPNVGETVGDFELVGLLGEGAFGRVFLAQQGELESRLVVLKFTSIMTDEHRLLARLQHTNIVPIYSVHRIGELQAICMPLLGVATLEDVLNHCGKSGKNRKTQHSNALVQTVNKQRELTVANTIGDETNARYFRKRQQVHNDNPHSDKDSSMREFAAQFICQMAEGLGFAHQRNIVHGDLKPANLLVSDDGHPVILDFHLSHVIDEGVGHLIGGTLPYMAPEHLLAMSDAHVKLKPTMDIYSAGVILYQLLTGGLPFDDELDSTFSTESLAQFKRKPFVVSDSDRQLMGQDLAAIVESCLDPKPERRFANGTVLAAELQRSIEYQPLRIAANGSLPNRLSKWAKRHPRLSSGSSILAACSLLIVGLVFAFLVVNSRLNTLDAISGSESRIELGKSLQPSLATTKLHDPSFFESTIREAENRIVANSWSDRQALFSQRHFNYLSQNNAQAEAIAAAELHFWLAENYRRQALVGRDSSVLAMAANHNEQANLLWTSDFSKNSISHQRNLIQLTEDGVSTKTLNFDSRHEPDNRLDRILSAYLQPKDPVEKQVLMLKLVQEDESDFFVWLLLGNYNASQGNFAEAEAYFTVCSSLDNESSLPLLFRGQVRSQQGKLFLALEDFEAAHALDPDDVTILLNHALELGKNKEYKKALTKYDRAIELGACQTRVWYLRSRLRKALDDDSGAEEDFEKFMKMKPVDKRSFFARGTQKIKTDPEGAIEDFEAALAYDPQMTIAYNNIAHVYSETLNQPEKAIENMTKVVQLDKFNHAAIAARGVLFARTGQVEAALADAKTALRMNKSAHTKYVVAGIYAQLSKLDEKFAARSMELLAQAAFENPRLVKRMSKTDPDIVQLKEDVMFTSIFDAISILEAETTKN